MVPVSSSWSRFEPSTW